MIKRLGKAKKNKHAFPIGIIAAILAVIGLITVIRFSADTIKNVADKTADKKEYEQMLTPVVMFDPDPFDDLTQADVSQLLNSAVWALLMSEEGTEKYPYSEGDVFGIIGLFALPVTFVLLKTLNSEGIIRLWGRERKNCEDSTKNEEENLKAEQENA